MHKYIPCTHSHQSTYKYQFGKHLQYMKIDELLCLSFKGCLENLFSNDKSSRLESKSFKIFPCFFICTDVSLNISKPEKLDILMTSDIHNANATATTSTAQHSTAQHSTAQHSTAQHTNTQTNKHTHKQTNKHTNKQTPHTIRHHTTNTTTKWRIQKSIKIVSEGEE